MGQGKQILLVCEFGSNEHVFEVFTVCVACDECGIESFGYVCCSDVYFVLLGANVCEFGVCGITKGMILSDGVFCTFSPCGVVPSFPSRISLVPNA